MKTHTVITALIVGICLNLSAQNKGKTNQHFASYKTFTATVPIPNSDNGHLFNGGFRLEIAENKHRKTFAELSDLGEGFYASFDVKVSRDWLPKIVLQEVMPISTHAQKAKGIPSVDLHENSDLGEY
jgi:hypothetical protein